MDVETPLELQAYLGIAGILLALQPMIELMGILHTFLLSEESWDHVLYERHKDKLSQFFDDIVRAAAKTLDLVKTAFPAHKDDPHYLLLSRFLNGLRLMLEQDSEEVTIFDDYELEDLEMAINHLFRVDS